MRTMGLDYGERRIGVAVSDPTGSVAQPLETIQRSRSGQPTHLDRIAQIVEEYEVDRIVVGLPLHLDGGQGPAAEAARSFGKRVEERTRVSVEFLDERWTSVEARRTLHEAGLSTRKQRNRVDPIAAALLLRAYMARSSL